MQNAQQNDRIWIGGEELTFAEAKDQVGLTGPEIATREIQEWMPAIGMLPNPDPILRAQGKSIATYRNMIDGHLIAVKSKRVAAVKSAPWMVEKGKANAAYAERIRLQLESFKIRDVIAGFLEAVFMGYSASEVVWDLVDGWIMPVKIEAKPQEWFAFGVQSQLQLRSRTGRYEDVPPRKFLVAKHQGSFANPYGLPLMSACFWPIAFKKGGLKFWALFCEKWGSAKALGKVPASTTKEDKNKLARQLASLIRDAVGVIPDNASVEVIEAAGKSGSGDLYRELVRWADSEMSKAILGETLTTEQGANGSRSATEVHNDVRADLAQDDANLVEQTVNQLIRWIYEINAPAESNLPWFSIVMPKDLQAGRVQRDGNLWRMGLRFKNKYFVDTYGIDPDHIDSVDNSKGQVAGAEFAEGESTQGPGEDDIRKLLTDFAPEELQGQIDEIAKPIIDLAAKQGSYAEFEEALDKALPGLSFTQFNDAIEKCMLLAEMKGKTDDRRTHKR